MSREAIALAMTGASGAVYGLRLLECLLQAQQTVYLMLSPAAQIVLAQETDLKVPGAPAEQEKFFGARYGAREGQLKAFGPNAWFSPPASGSNVPRAMVVCPCTSGALAAIAQGSADNLIERAADVAIKEGRKLILVPRETPLSAIHLENMLKLARLGVVILPPSPGFYHQPRRIEDLVDFVVARLLDHLGIEHQLVARWADEAPGDQGGTVK
ncbi:MAG TPA: flavin prenyltransferase UbiX [Acidiferrobacterales bacterium]|nr:flavin prenyltransferase UbiX [Acidiferrobacterales bacterium]